MFVYGRRERIARRGLIVTDVRRGRASRSRSAALLRSTRRLMSIRWPDIQSPEQSVVVAIFLEHDRLEKDVRQIDVGVAVHDLDDAARSVFGKIGQRCDDVGPADLV